MAFKLPQVITDFLSSKGLDKVLDILQFIPVPIVGTVAKTLDKVKDVITETPDFKKLPELDQKQFIELYNAETARMAQQDANDLEALKVQLLDVQSARAQNVAIQNSPQANWPSKWTPYLIAWALTLVWSAFTLYLGAKAIGVVSNDNADLTGVLSIYSTVTAMFGVVLYFYYGSSTGAKSNGDTIREMVKKQQ